MSFAGTDELLLLELDASGSSPASPGGGRSLSALVDAVGCSSRRLSRDIEIATALDDLRARDLVDSDGADGPGPTVFNLTERGEDRAAAVRERLADVSITVVDDDGERHDRPLAAVASSVDRSLVAVAADCTAEGVYYRQGDFEDAVVGRDAERRRCRSVLANVRENGDGRILALAGPGGVGKTALAEGVLERARDEGFVVGRAQCRGAGKPYQPVRDLLAALSVDSPFPSVGPVADDPEVFRSQQTGLFYDLTRRLTPADDESPRVLFLDDLHDADAATMAYLEYLRDDLSDRRLVILGSYRPAEMEADTPITDDDAGAVEVLRLGPLDRTGTRGVIERAVDRRGAPDAFVDAVHERTGGNPLFVEETVSTLLETGQLDPGFEWYPEDADAVDVPPAVRETVERRVATLDAATGSVLRWAALVGERVPVAVIRECCDIDDSRLDALLEALVESRIFEWTADRRAVAFRNAVVREALTADLERDERRERHAAIAAALEAATDVGAGVRSGSAERDRTDDASSSRAAAIATHHELAGNDEAAVAWYRRAGERATDVYAHDAAVDHYHSALALVRDGDDDEAVLDVAERLAEIYLTTGAFDRAERFVDFVAERTDEVPRRQRLAVLRARVANARGDYGVAIERADDGLALDESPSPTRCRLLAQRAKAERLRSEFERAGETLRHQRDVAAALDEPLLEARARRELAEVLRNRGEYERARAHLGAALETFDAAGSRHDVADTRVELGTIAWNRGDLETARSAFEDVLETYREIGARLDVASARLNLGVVTADQGEYEAAETHYREALEAFRAIGNDHRAAVCRHNLGALAIPQGKLSAAAEHLEAARETGRAVGDRQIVARARLYLGSLAISRGNYEAAAEELRDARETANEVGDRRLAARVRPVLGELAHERGEYDRAAELLRAACEEFRDLEDRQGVARTRMMQGELAVTRGEYERARDELETALGTFEETGDSRFVARIRMYLGKVAVEEGEYESARALLESALDTYETVGVRLGIASANRFLGELAVAEGEYEDAERRLERAREIGREAGARPDLARAALVTGELALAKGEPDEAAALFRRAFEELSERGATDDALEALEGLVRTGRAMDDDDRVRTWCRTASTLLQETDASYPHHREWIERTCPTRARNASY